MLPDLLQSLSNAKRLLLTIELEPLPGFELIQPSTFSDIGHCTYGNNFVVVDTEQSIANRLETAIWNDEANEVISELKGIPYIRGVDAKGNYLLSSITEAHRMASHYFLDDPGYLKLMQQELLQGNVSTAQPIHSRKLAQVASKYDLNSVHHGVFMATSKISGGRFKMDRLCTGVILQRYADRVEVGGVKLDFNPSGGEKKAGDKGGKTNVPFIRTRFKPEWTHFYFNIDLQLLHSYRFDDALNQLILAMLFFKLQKFLEEGLRLRSNCDLLVKAIQIQTVQMGQLRSTDFQLPLLDELAKILPKLVESVYPDGGIITTVTIDPKKLKLQDAKLSDLEDE